MKKTLITFATVLLAVAILLGSAFLYGRFSAMSDMRVERPDIALGPLPLTQGNYGEVYPGLIFRIDIGASANTISQKYIDRLKADGIPVDSSYVLTYMRTHALGPRITTKRYRVSLPVFAYDIAVDSAGHVTSRIDTTNRINTVYNVDFVPTADERDMPRFGRPFIAKFFMEFDFNIRAVRFHASLPAGYEPIDGLKREFALFYDPGLFLNIKVEGKPMSFFVNTAMPRIGLLKPANQAPKVNNRTIYSDSVHSIYGEFPAVIDYDTWVEWNDRAGNSACYYSDYGHREYAVNPFNFLTQDAVFNIAKPQVYLRPYTKKFRHMRSNDQYVKRPA